MLYFIFKWFINLSFASDLNYIQTEHLRDAQKSSSLLYSSSAPTTSRYIPDTFSFNNTIWATKETKATYDDFRSKNNQAIAQRLDQSYGTPYEAFLHVGFQGNAFDYNFGLNNTASTLMMTQNPVYPTVDLFVMQDHNLFLAKKFFLLSTWYVMPQVNYGMRKVLKKSYTTSELVNDGLKIRLNQIEFKNYLSSSFTTKIKFYDFYPFLELNAIPVAGNDSGAWNSQLGVSSANLFSYFLLPRLFELTFNLSYSPFYAGHYDVSRTIKSELNFNYAKSFYFDFLLEDEFSPGARLAYKLYFLEIAAFTRLRAYDDYHFQRARIYGGEFSLSW